MKVKKHYAKRNIDSFDGHYFNHLMAMTSEKLHAKTDIAAELGFRDMQIEQLQAENEQLKAERDYFYEIACEYVNPIWLDEQMAEQAKKFKAQAKGLEGGLK